VVSLGSVLFASLLCSSVLTRSSGFGFRAWVMNALYFGFATFMCSLPGWFVALPIVLFVSNTRGWRFWALLALGAGIGPLVMFVAALYFQITSPNSGPYAPEARNLVFLATCISTLATIFCLFGLRYLSKSHPL